ncbi:hypothetical protein [Streptomyces sp. NBC_01462]|uniref:hypothetical protein n=1 Tax=Streptomyces sp. NBC_01462 TaxID=2903876 RepID=UPI002E2EAE39|nr:hypothetical protein [Streptomyces sp. NBC_01462]
MEPSATTARPGPDRAGGGRRAAELRVTDAGRQMLRETDHTVGSVEAPLLDGLTAEE